MTKKLLLTALVVVSVHAMLRAQIVPGQNINVNPGIVDEFVGDRFLQRQVESKIVCASNNPQLCVSISNDYRTVDQTTDPNTGFGEGLAALMRGLFGPKYTAAGPDAWLGLYRSFGGKWLNGLVPGFPQDTSPLGLDQPWHGFGAASDGALASDGVHFYGAGLFFNRGGPSMIGAFRLTAYNDESKFPIRYDDGFSWPVESSATNGGVFSDLPTILADPPRTGGAACGRVYIGFTRFAAAPSQNSSLYVSRSSDCGATYSPPLKISGNILKNQRVVLAVDPRPGTNPMTTGGGTVYAVWRGFQPDRIYFAKSTDFGATWTVPVAITGRSGPANLCTYDQPTRGANPTVFPPDVYTLDPQEQTSRALAFASAQVDLNGMLHVVFTERVDPATGLPLSGAACQANKQPKIVYTSTTNGGSTWCQRFAVDTKSRCETVAAPGQAAGLERPLRPNGTCPAGTVLRQSGPQIQPALSYNGGKLMLLYSEGRAIGPQTGFLMNGYHSGRNTQMDIRAARLNPASGALLSTTQLSQYDIDVSTNDIRKVPPPPGSNSVNPPGAKAYSRMYLPQYQGGKTAFKGDHDDMTPAEALVWGFSPAGAFPHFATPAEMPAIRFYGIWGGDTREALFPGGNLFDNVGWTLYVNPGTGGPSGCNAGIRNSNNYVAYVGSEIEAFVHQSFKPPLVVGGPDRQRTWVGTIRNRSGLNRTVRLVLEDRKSTGLPAGDASFDQFQDVEVIGSNPADPSCAAGAYPGCTAYRTILPFSSMTFTVFGEVTDPAYPTPFRISVFDATLSGAPPVVTKHTLAAIVRLNPNPINAPLPATGIGNQERHGPAVEGPFVETQGNPTQGNPTQGNPTQGNPTQGNPTQGNAGFEEYTDYRFDVSAPGANTISQFRAFANIANAEAVDASHLVQMIITKRHNVPTLDASVDGCPPTERLQDEVVSTITVPGSKDLGVPTQGNPTQGNPTQGNPTQGNPTQGNPTQGNPTQGNNTFAVAPSDLPDVGASLAAKYRATALASTSAKAVSSLLIDMAGDGSVVGEPGIDFTHVTFRFFHCRMAPCGNRPGGGPAFVPEPLANEIVPRTCEMDPCGPDEPASALTGFVVIAGAGDNINGVVQPPTFAGAGPDLRPTGPEGETSFTVTPSTVAQGGTFQLSDFIARNEGTAASGPSSYRFFARSGTGVVTWLSESFELDNLSSGEGEYVNLQETSFSTTGLSPGTYAVGVFVDDGDDVAESDEFDNVMTGTLTVTEAAEPVQITTTFLPDGTVGTAYNQTLTATGGTPGYTWSIVSGALPPGLSLNPSTGVISGTPTSGGLTSSFQVRAQDSSATPQSDTQNLNIRVVGASFFIESTDYAVGGLGGVRGSDSGTITISGVSGTIQRALLYWHGPTNSTNPAANSMITFNGVSITGTNIGFAHDNCWGFSNSQGYRADVTAQVTATQTSYPLANLRKFEPAVAEINGVSLLVFYDDGNPLNNKDVYLFDGNDSNVASAYEGAAANGWDRVMTGITTFAAGRAGRLELHVSDGQFVYDDSELLLDGFQLVPRGPIFQGGSVPNGPTAPGTSGGLWDIKSFDITQFLTVGVNNLTLQNGADGGDCISCILAAVVVEAPQAGTALSFDGIDDFVNIPDSASLDLSSGGLTVEGWVRIDNPAGMTAPLLSKGPNFGNYTLGVTGTGDPSPQNVYYAHDPEEGAVSCCSITPGPVPFGRWVHVAATVSAEGRTLSVYVNGEFVSSVGGQSSQIANSAALLFGRILLEPSERRLTGLLDEVRIWSFERSAAQIAESYSRFVSPGTAGLVGYWKFDEATGQIVVDSTEGGNFGTLGASSAPASDDPVRVPSTVPIIGTVPIIIIP